MHDKVARLDGTQIALPSSFHLPSSSSMYFLKWFEIESCE